MGNMGTGRIRHGTVLAAALAVALGIVAVGTNAEAQEASDADSSVEEPEEAETPKGFKHFSVTGNALNVFLFRLSANFEYLPVPHHAIMITPSIGGIPGLLGMTGIEVGYHFYSGSKGANGFFVGPSLLAYRFDVFTIGGLASANIYGIAIDVGGQHIFDGGFTLGAGMGMARWWGADGEAVTFPRILFTLGYSW